MIKYCNIYSAVKISIIVFLLLSVSISYSQILVPANKATNVSADMQFRITFNSAPQLQRSGNIRLYQSNGTLIQTINLASQPAGTPLSATWPWTETLNGAIIRVVPVTVDGNSVYIRFSIGAMKYNTSYYVTVDQSIFSNATTIGFTGISAINWSFTTRTQPTADLNYIVSADGTGDFATLQGALDFLPTGKTNAKIFIKNGTYVGLAYTKNKSNYTIEGENKTGVILKGYNCSDLNASTHWRSVVNLQGDDITILNVTFINTVPNGGGQAEALKLSGTRCIIVNCQFYSYQDTVLIEGKVYFKDCMLEGDVDFIWGTGTVFFQSCELRANDNGGYNVMARNDNTKHGYAFADCKLTKTSTATKTQYLGRDAGTGYPYAEIVYLNCEMGSQIPAVGWQIRSELGGTGIMFAEYKSVDESGNLKNVSSRHSLSKQLTASQATQYRDLNWFFNGWIPVVPNQQNSPTVSITSPTNNTSKIAPASFTLTATATDSDGTVSKVEFYNGTTVIGTKTTVPYSIAWNNLVAGTYTITAKATDNSNASTTSTPITIVVTPGPRNIIYNCATTDDWTSSVNWTPAEIPTTIDTAIIRTGEAKVSGNIAPVVKVEPSGIFRLTANVTTPDLRLQGGTLKSFTSNPLFVLNSTVTVEQASTIWAGSLITSVFQIDGVIKGSGNLTKTYTGILSLNANATAYTGNWNITEGTLRIANNKSIGQNAVNIAANATLNIATANVTIDSVTLNGTLILGNNLTVRVCSIASAPLPAGVYTAAQYPTNISGTGTLTVLECNSCAVTQTISLSKGWNLFSTNIDATGIAIENIFSGLEVVIIKNAHSFWKAGQNNAFNSLQTITAGEGYLIFMNNAGNLVISGTPISFSNFQISQFSNYQLIGCPYKTSTPFSTQFNTSNCQIIKNFDGFWEPNGTQNSIQNFEQGKAYFIKK